jgi:hypothetical protein
MKSAFVLAFAMLVAGSGSASASSILYEFNFHPVVFTYESDVPTDPGTDVSDLLRLTSPDASSFLSGFRGANGAWSFTRAFPTTSFMYLALTDTSFPNSPGDYLGLPALFVTRFGDTSPLTVDISIIAIVPEPGNSSMALAGLLLLLGFVSKTCRRLAWCSAQPRSSAL